MIDVPMVRPTFNDRQWHLDKWVAMDITVLVCQRQTKDLIQLCLESLLRFYPDIPVLLVDGDSGDDSLLYCKYMEQTNSNIRVWERKKRENGQFTSHGDTMDEAITQYITTKYVLLLDSDIIVMRGGWIEEMLKQFDRNYGSVIQVPIYAIGTLMNVSESGQACSPPKDENDILPYAHPSCSIIDRDKYMELRETSTDYGTHQVLNKFSNHGAPCAYNMIAAKKMGLDVLHYPIDKYVIHLSGGSWVDPRIVWESDKDVLVRPFITFVIMGGDANQLQSQTDKDFDIVFAHAPTWQHVRLQEDGDSSRFTNSIYGIRFNVHGEYVCVLKQGVSLNENFVSNMKVALGGEERMFLFGAETVKRESWQRYDCLKND